jgi:hypothetical protein
MNSCTLTVELVEKSHCEEPAAAGDVAICKFVWSIPKDCRASLAMTGSNFPECPTALAR